MLELVVCNNGIVLAGSVQAFKYHLRLMGVTRIKKNWLGFETLQHLAQDGPQEDSMWNGGTAPVIIYKHAVVMRIECNRNMWERI